MSVLLAAAAAIATVTTPTGWRAGTAAAPLKLVEYGSLNCPHCAHFSQAADEQIMGQVAAGRASFEFRPYLIFPHDPAATLVARCVPLSRRFAFTRDYYRNAAAITERLRTAMARDEAAFAAAREQGIGAFNRKVLGATGMTAVAARHGLTPAAANRCVADPAGLAWLQRAQAAAKADGVSGTPTYRLNGQKLDVGTPEELLAKLK
jgi:protein-disulfide isomerase